MNPYRQLLALIPTPPTLAGTVTATRSDGVVVTLSDGGTLLARGTASIGDTVYIRGNDLVGPAPDLSGVDITV